MGLLFGRSSSAHPSDVFIRNVALVVLLALGVLLIWDQTNRPKKGNFDISCWMPAHYTKSHEEYANHLCRETERKYVPYDGLIPQNPRNVSKTNIDFKTEKVRRIYTWASDFAAYSIGVNLVAESAIVAVAYLLLRNIAGRASTQARVLQAGVSGSGNQVKAALRLKSSFFTGVSYIFVQLIYFICMVIMLGKTRSLIPASLMKVPQLSQGSQVYLCDFEVRQLGNVRRYTVQCIGTPPEPEMPSGILQLVIYADVVLCGVLALMILLHLIQTVLLAPSSIDVTAAYGSEVISSTADRLLFGCSDMNLAAMFLGDTGIPRVVVVPQGGGLHAQNDPGAAQLYPTLEVEGEPDDPKQGLSMI